MESTQILPPEQGVLPKPLSHRDKLKLMIVRIGDERRQLVNDHLVKLKDFILSEETQKNHRDIAIDTLVSCI